MDTSDYFLLEIAEQLALPLNQVREILALPPEEEIVDECFDENGEFLPRGRCDTCGKPCDEDGCTADRSHEIAIV